MIINSIVTLNLNQNTGVVVEAFPYGGKTLYHVHYVDHDTGKLMVCPDTRCKGEHTCPIHGSNVEVAREMTRHDLLFFVREGMLDKSLLRKAIDSGANVK